MVLLAALALGLAAPLENVKTAVVGGDAAVMRKEILAFPPQFYELARSSSLNPEGERAFINVEKLGETFELFGQIYEAPHAADLAENNLFDFLYFSIHRFRERTARAGLDNV